MKPWVLLAAVLLLASCDSAPLVQTRIGGAWFASGPTSFDDPRMLSPQFYMDDSDSLPAWTRIAPASNR